MHDQTLEETSKVEALKALAEAKRREQASAAPRLASVRVSPGGYFAAASILTFASVLLLRAESHTLALVALATAWVVMPTLAFTDRIVFDGRSLSRRGVLPSLLKLLTGTRPRLSLGEFERVSTNAVRTLRRGGSVRYRYRSQIIGKGISFILASGG